MASYRTYRGYKIQWLGSRDGGHWMIYDQRLRFLSSAEDYELDRVIDELASED